MVKSTSHRTKHGPTKTTKREENVAGSFSSRKRKRMTPLLVLTAMGSFAAGRATHYLDGWQTYAKLTSLVETAIVVVSDTASSNNTNGMMYPPYLPEHHMLQDAPLFINDRTMRLSPYVDRLWLKNNDSSTTKNNDEQEGKQQKRKQPKAKILLTDFGWNQPNQTEGIKYTRSTRMREIAQAVIDHPLFDPTFYWTESMDQAAASRQAFDPYIQYFVFLDVETCFESNYPHYAQGKDINFDVAAKRPVYETLWRDTACFEIRSCHFIQSVLRSPLFQQVPTARLFFFECRGMGVDSNFRTKGLLSPQLSIVSLSSGSGQLLATDMGQPPPAINPLRLSSSQRTAIQTTCENDRDSDSTGKGDDASLINERAILKTKLRPYFFSFIGSRRRTETRDRLFALHNLDQGILIMQIPSFEEMFHPQQITDQQVMEGSIFAAAPRGDNLFSYRFTEVLSAGAIPVVHSDGWVLPFSHQLIDWAKECAVIIPENKVNETIFILKQIDPATRCRMRRRCYDIYVKYMANAEGTVAGVLETASRMMS